MTGGYGYAGIFDPRKIREPELMKHYEFDLKVAEGTEIIENSLEKLKEATDQRLDINVAAKNLIKEIENLERLFKKRHEFIIAEEPVNK